MKSGLFVILVLFALAARAGTLKPTSPKCDADLSRYIYAPKSTVSWAIARAIHKSVDCSNDPLCQAIRIGLRNDTNREDCLASSHPGWCEGIKQAVYDNCRDADNWMNIDTCIGLNYVLSGGTCEDDKGLAYENCNDFVSAGYTRKAIEKFNSDP